MIKAKVDQNGCTKRPRQPLWAVLVQRQQSRERESTRLTFSRSEKNAIKQPTTKLRLAKTKASILRTDDHVQL